MSILFHCAGDDQDRLLQKLRAQLPEQTIRKWPDVGDPALITQACVWQPPDDFFDRLLHLTHVFSISAGVDHLLTHPGLPIHIPIVRLYDGGMSAAMSEYVLYGVLHAQRRMTDLSVAQRSSHWLSLSRVPAASQFRVGILGAGALGSKVASRLHLNGYPVSCWSRTERSSDHAEHVHGLDALPEFLQQIQVLVCLLPLTDSTRGILDARVFNALPAGAYLINPGRGGHLVERDLIDALDSGQLSGALLDVFDPEPLTADNPLWQHERVIVTPHLAAPTPATEAVEHLTQSINDVASGRPPVGLVDRALGY